jgi:hypothetical protein
MTTSPHTRWRLEQEAEDVADDDDGVCSDCDEIWDCCECHVGDECGRWDNGRLGKHCSKAGSEECDFECPYRNSLKF